MLLILILAAWGLTQIVVYSSIFAPVRDYVDWEVLKCPMCFGFWAGAAVHLIMTIADISFITTSGLMSFIGSLFLAGFIASATSYTLCMLIDDNGLKINSGD